MSELVTCHVCGEIAKYRIKKLCARCYQRQKANGDFDTHQRERQKCTVAGCNEWVKAYGYCTKHWRRVQTHGDTEDRKWTRRGSDRCAVPHCGQRHRAMGLCEAHYNAEQKRGHPLWRTLGRRKVHGDRPWTAETVSDLQRLIDGESRATLTAVRTFEHPTEGDDVTTTAEAQTCPDCQQTVVPEVCGEKVGTETCTDLLCPICGEELPDTPPEG